MLIQNTNPMTVAPEQALVRQGFARPDLFTVVHEQFMTETAQMADIVLPATMFMEHDDLYYGGGHQHISVGPKLIDPPGECRSNHQVLQALALRLERLPWRDADWQAVIAQLLVHETYLFRDWPQLEHLAQAGLPQGKMFRWTGSAAAKKAES